VTWLSAIERSPLATWVREDNSIFAYPGILFLHTAALAVVVGLSAVIDLRLLGVARRMPVAPLERFFPIIWTAFVVDAITGTLLLAADATTKLTSPVFSVKMACVAGAAVVTAALRRAVFRAPTAESLTTRKRTWLAVASLALWVGATAAGRLMAYLGAVAGLPGS